MCSAVMRVMSHLCRPAATLLFIPGAAWAPLSCVWAFFGVPLPLVCMQLPGWVSQNGEQPLVVGIVGVCITLHSVLVPTHVKGWSGTCVQIGYVPMCAVGTAHLCSRERTRCCVTVCPSAGCVCLGSESLLGACQEKDRGIQTGSGGKVHTEAMVQLHGKADQVSGEPGAGAEGTGGGLCCLHSRAGSTRQV